MKILQLALAFAVFLSMSEARECPIPTASDPCLCAVVGFPYNFQTLGCGYPTLSQPTLQSYLEKVESLSNGSPEDNHWTSFSLFNSGLTDLPAETFANLTFSTVQIQANPELTFNPQSLSHMNNTLAELIILEQAIVAENLFFKGLNELSRLSNLDVQNLDVKELPDGAFEQDHYNLSQINLNSNPISYIGKHAFYGLNHLSTIYLQSHTSDKEVTFHPEAFVFKDPSTYVSKGFNFHLDGFGVTAQLLENLELDKFNREWVYIHLNNNPNLSHLPESAFGPYFAQENSTNYVFFKTERDGSHMDSFPDCSECGLKWLVEKGEVNVHVLQWEDNPDPENPNRISKVRCTNSAGEKVLLVEQDFSHCT